MPHFIRLRHPWECERTARGWRFARRFQSPTGITPADRLSLEIESAAVSGTVRLNGKELGPLDPAGVNRYPLENLRAVGNQLELELIGPEEFPPEGRLVPGPLIGEVRLVIEAR